MLKSLRSGLGGLALAAVALLAACGPAETPAPPKPAAEAPVKVFAASSLTDVLKTIGADYVAEGHPAPLFNFAATSELARQVDQGAEADLFISADADWMNKLADNHRIDPASRATLLTNTLVLVTPADKPIKIELKPGMDLKAALKGGKLSIANPDSVPAGKYAREALEHYNAWAGVEVSTARAENVRAALRFVETGEAAAGIVYSTDAKAAGASVVISAEFPADSHTPITYPVALLAGKSDGPGKGFLAFLTSEKAKYAFTQAGFGLH